MSELVNVIASDSGPSSPDSQLYVVGVQLSKRLASKSSSYCVEGKWLRLGDACVVEHGDDYALGKVWLPPRLPARIQLEQFRMTPNIGAVVCDKQRQIANQTDAAPVGVVT